MNTPTPEQAELAQLKKDFDAVYRGLELWMTKCSELRRERDTFLEMADTYSRAHLATTEKYKSDRAKIEDALDAQRASPLGCPFDEKLSA